MRGVIINYLGRGGDLPRQCVALARALARPTLGLLGLGLVLAGCESADNPAPGVIAAMPEPAFVGGAVADEPRAVLVARDALAAGGTAADAAVALYFALAVTYPSSASLGSGGACLVYRPNKDAGDQAEFVAFPALPGRPSTVSHAERPSAVPAVVRGMFALHARYGALRWEQLLAPAESLARFGHPISRAFATQLVQAAPELLGDETSRHLFADEEGRPLGEGQKLTQLDLASVIAQLRIKGPGDFYNGQLAGRLVEATRAAGGTLAIEDLRSILPSLGPALAMPLGLQTVYVTPPPAASGVTMAALLAILKAQGNGIAATDQPHFLLEAETRVGAESERLLKTLPMKADRLDPDALAALMNGYDAARHGKVANAAPASTGSDAAATSFSTVDRSGMAVTCSVSMNRPFGIGKTLPGLGIVLAAAPADGRSGDSGASVIVTNANVHQVFLAASAGGSNATGALATVLQDTLLREQPIAQALRAPRVHQDHGPDQAVVEAALGEGARAALEKKGHALVVVPSIAQVDAVACPGGLPREPGSCVFTPDPRGAGLGTGGVF
jgi:gamma-glutamyltranspeptidase/glutathione hydrolase